MFASRFLKKIKNYEGHETLKFVNGEENHGECEVFIEVTGRGTKGKVVQNLTSP